MLDYYGRQGRFVGVKILHALHVHVHTWAQHQCPFFPLQSRGAKVNMRLASTTTQYGGRNPAPVDR